MPTTDSTLTNDIKENRAKFVVGVCAMDRKARSKPMRFILNKLLCYGDFEIVIFGDKTILDEKVENWPGCDFLICFFSTGFPMQKAIEYTKLRKPFSVNHVLLQTLLWDRRVVLSILDAMGIPTPPRIVVSRDGGVNVSQDAADAFKDLSGLDLYPILEKYSSNSTEITLTDDRVQLGQESLQKPFVEKPVDSENHNINIYYANGEGGRRLFRKIGNKSSDFDPQLSTPCEEGSWIYEQLMETENCEDIKLYTVGPQFVHAETRKSPIVDGHVRRNTDGKEIRYCVQLTEEEEEIARKVSSVFGQTVCGLDILRVQGKSYVIDVNGWSFVKGNDFYYDSCARILKEAFYQSIQSRLADPQIPSEISPAHAWKLKGFVSVFRHGDRTPKEKLKMSITEPPLIDLLEGSTREVVFRQKHQLKAVRAALDECNPSEYPDLVSLKEVLDKKHDLPGTKVQLKPKYDKETHALNELQVIVKWGGEFTHAGRHQTKDLAENFRKDMTILNKKILENVKIYSSSERRVRDTAEVFARWLLGDPKSLDDIISESKYLLDDSNAAKEPSDAVKRKLKELLKRGSVIPESDLIQMGWYHPVQPSSVFEEISGILQRLQRLMHQHWPQAETIQRRWCCLDSPLLFRERWDRLFRNMTEPDPCWIPALYDSLKYDALHNKPFLEAMFPTELDRLYKLAKDLFAFVAPHEFGMTDLEKKNIGMLISFPLLKTILADLDDMKSAENPKTRLYFTKESHVHTLLNLIYLSGVPTKVPKNTLPELDFLTQITFELYERNRQSKPEKEYSLRIGFSSGAHYDNVLDLSMNAEHCLKVAPRRNLIPHLLLEEVLTYHKGYLNVPDLKSIEEQIEERKLYYAQEDNQ